MKPKRIGQKKTHKTATFPQKENKTSAAPRTKNIKMLLFYNTGAHETGEIWPEKHTQIATFPQKENKHALKQDASN